MDIFQSSKQSVLKKEAPLAARMRPETLDEFMGQDHILGPGRLLRRAIIADQLSSLIFYGPPGTGKTTLARIIANTTKSEFISMNAVLAGVKDIKAAISQAEENLKYASKRSILFVDEVHRFNKSQQDALLPHVENGTIIFIGATTENPYFEVNKALVSRSRIFQLQSLENADLKNVLHNTLADKKKGFGSIKIEINDEAIELLVNVSNGDARSLLNALELAVNSTEGDENGIIQITRKVAEESIQKKAVLYDKDGDAHYDTISAFIKSIRGSDPDASLYWLAKMVYAGEDPRFIFRRLLILASEDVGLADPQALSVVQAAAQSYDYVGMPEGQFHMSQAVLYLATCEKSNSTLSYFSALQTVREEKIAEVPNHLKDGNRDKEGFGHGVGYKYPHAYQEHWVAQNYLPSVLQGKSFYKPGDIGYEGQIKEKIEVRKELQLAAILQTEETAFDFTEVHMLVKGQGGQAKWKQRTEGQAVAYYQRCRDILMDCCQLKPDDLVLDLKFGTGLLTWELLRKIRNQSVYTIVKSKQEKQLVETGLVDKNSLSDLVQLYGESRSLKDFFEKDYTGVQFDCIVGYRSFLHFDQIDFAKTIKQYWVGSKLAFLERLPFYVQRPSALLIQKEGLQKWSYLKEAEDKVFIGENSPVLQLTIEQIKEAFLAQGISLKIDEFSFDEEIKISDKYLDRLFPGQNKTAEKSYANILSKTFSKSELENLKSDFRNALLGASVQISNPHQLFYAK